MTLAPDDQSCAQCRYYLAPPGGGGFCHRNPPSVWLPTAEYRQSDKAQRITVEWPAVRPDDWCGEFGKLTAQPTRKPKDQTL